MAGETKYLTEKALEVLEEKADEDEDINDVVIRLAKQDDFKEKLEDIDERVSLLEEMVEGRR